ncbi:hypothetical protein TNCV_3120721 [Trichonephila clavipes]|uniref:Uncharacterized protein n=1 Tax=Trichonephila clavipes TaxID=2585209 RepID=A0A8X6WAC3_TRICX|nr:hypothetical protein TNCV_3120721 [Trichonephila clavipes]
MVTLIFVSCGHLYPLARLSRSATSGTYRQNLKCDGEDAETWMACDAEDCGFQMLNDDEIVTSVHEESEPVDDEIDEDEDSNNNESSKGP